MERVGRNDLFQRVRDVLAECDDAELERIANEVLVERVSYDASASDPVAPFVVVQWAEAERYPHAVDAIFREVEQALQNAEDIGGPEGPGYVRLMERVRAECAKRIETYVHRLVEEAIRRGSATLTR